MKVTINISEKTVKKSMAFLALLVDDAADYMNDVLATESVEIADFDDMLSVASDKDEAERLMYVIGALGCMQIIKNKVEPNEQV